MDSNCVNCNSNEPEWHYLVNGVQKGPVTKAHLEHLIQSGALGRNTMLWKPSFASWIPADQAGISDQNLSGQIEPSSLFRKVVRFVFGAVCILICIGMIFRDDSITSPTSTFTKEAIPLTLESINQYSLQNKQNKATALNSPSQQKLQPSQKQNLANRILNKSETRAENSAKKLILNSLKAPSTANFVGAEILFKEHPWYQVYMEVELVRKNGARAIVSLKRVNLG